MSKLKGNVHWIKISMNGFCVLWPLYAVESEKLGLSVNEFYTIKK